MEGGDIVKTSGPEGGRPQETSFRKNQDWDQTLYCDVQAHDVAPERNRVYATQDAEHQETSKEVGRQGSQAGSTTG